MGERKWTVVNIPREMYEEVKRLIAEHPELGYHSVSEFVKDAVRRYLMQLGFLPRSQTHDQ